MPFLIRIILQRVLVLFYSFLAFIGIAPEASIPTEQEAESAIEERQRSISDFFQEEKTRDTIQNIIDTTNRIRGEIIDVDKIDLDVNIPPPTQIEVNDPEISDSPQQTPQQTQEDEFREVIEETVDEVKTSGQSLTKGGIDDKIVNIVCSQKNGNLVAVSTGSGVIIDPEGVIITNAHVGQFVLIEDHHNNPLMKCGVYKENNPSFGYLVDVLYISPDWIKQNYKLINSNNPRGTGEFDYALLYITESTNPAKKRPRTFPYANIRLSENSYEIGETISVAGYPGSPEKLIDIVSAGNLKTDNVSITDVFTFNRNSIDIISTSKTGVGAKGASGGGLFDNNDNLIAIIVTTVGDQYNAEINALTTTYINNSLREKTGQTISSITNNPESGVEDFSEEFGQTLADLLIDEID